MISTIVITGLPGAGKTSLALALAYHLLQRHPFVLHTDILKVTLGQFLPILRGVTTDDNFSAKQQFIYPYLQAQADKAQRDGYLLIMEGTLALGFRCDHCLAVVVNTPLALRRERIGRKHDSARGITPDLPHYAQALQQSITADTLVLDGKCTIEQMVHTVQTRLALPQTRK
jgi:hypothetical protein